MATYVIEVKQLLLFPEAARRTPPVRRVLVSDVVRLDALALPRGYSQATALLSRPVEEPLAQVGLVDTRPLEAIERERDFLLDWGRTVVARVRREQAEEARRQHLPHALRMIGGNAELVDWLADMERRVRWLNDQIRRKRAADAWKLAS